jgi:hypothetical protein
MDAKQGFFISPLHGAATNDYNSAFLLTPIHQERTLNE